MLPQLLSAKIGVAALVAVLAGGTAAAAATGSLPDPAQRVVSSALSHVDVSVPAPNEHANAQAFAHAKGATDKAKPDHAGGKGPDATGPAKFGLCTAWSAGPSTTNPHSGKADSVAFSNLQQAATDAGSSVADFCKDAVHPHGPDTSTTTGTSTGTSTGKHAPPVSTPNSGGRDTADSASDGASDDGNGHASAKASAGSANAGDHPTDRP
ncbi:MAG: hypothetical protein QOI44_1449 [Actinomycetota bacterium]|jgi:hypothetical protein|nr:hypothetical protein [Actinomycetota bacterium]